MCLLTESNTSYLGRSRTDRTLGSRSGGRRVFCAICRVLLMFVMAKGLSAFPQKEAKDSVTVQADAVPLAVIPATQIVLHDQIVWSKLYTDWRFDTLVGQIPSCVSQDADKDQAYVFHIVHWRITDSHTPVLVSSSWSAYGSKIRHPDILNRRLAANGDPLIYGKKRVLLIGVNLFDTKNGASTLSIRYKSSITQGTPENTQALGQLVTSLLGLSTAAKAAQGQILIAFDCQEGTAHLPFEMNVVETIGLPGEDSPDTDHQPAAPNTKSSAPQTTSPSNPPGDPQWNSASHVPTAIDSDSSHAPTPRLVDTNWPMTTSVSMQTPAANGVHDQGAQNGGNNAGTKPAAQKPAGGQADCSGLSAKNNCTISRTFTSLDKEWWDVSLAVPIPGVRESQYSISSNTLISKEKTNTNLYALFDIYPWAKWVTKGSGIPHFFAGLPVTGQTFYRPAFGVSENLTGWWLERHGFPVQMSFFAGLVDMKTTIVQGSPTTAQELNAASQKTRVWKGIYGVEVPVSSLISKIGKSKNQNTNSGNGKSGNQGSTAAQ